MQRIGGGESVDTPTVFGRDAMLSAAVLASLRSTEEPSRGFVTVGAAHLAGPQGLAKSLTQAGFVVKRLEPAK